MLAVLYFILKSVTVTVALLLFLRFLIKYVTRQRFHVNKTGIVLISGTSSGIGHDAALALHKLGYVVYCGARNLSDVDDLREQGLRPIKLDVSSDSSVADALAVITAAMSSSSLKFVGLINNAGISKGLPLELENMESVKQVFDVNVFGAIRLIKAFAPLLRATSGSRIVNISSVNGIIATPRGTSYCGSKFAIEAVSDVARRELGPPGHPTARVSVSVVQPAYVKTKIAEKALGNLPWSSLSPSSPSYLAYAHILDNFTSKRSRIEEKASTTEVTTEVIVHAMVSEYPETRYVVANMHGIPAWILAWLIWILPDRACDHITK